MRGLRMTDTMLETKTILGFTEIGLNNLTLKKFMTNKSAVHNLVFGN
jgi:hypothetical protein